MKKTTISTYNRTNHTLEIYPSIMAADFLHLERDLTAVKSASGIHFDVMDGHFVPNITFGSGMLNTIRRVSPLPISVHLMVEHPQEILQQLLPSLTKKDVVYLHVELPFQDLTTTIKILKRSGINCGLTLRPSTPITRINRILNSHPTIKRILILGAQPGFYGQPMSHNTLQRISYACKRPGNIKVYVDEGVTLKNAKQLKKAGASGIISGHAIFFSKGKKPASVIEALRKL